MTETTARPVVVLERALAILNVLATAKTDLGTNEIARRAGVNPSSASRLLATLARGELVRRTPDTGRYNLGLRLVELGNAALSRIDLRDIARPHLTALMEATGETATLSVPGETTAMTLDFVQSPSTVRSVAEIGRPSVPHATAIGKVYLAYGGPLPDTTLVPCTHRTITDRVELEKALAEVRERGWADGLEERELGLHAIAAPVLDASAHLVAILGLQGPSWRFDAAAMKAGVPVLLEHASALWRGPGR
ncbi:MAG TPA: IclR family transcriptional regulator [Jiangellaceae bacterium]